METPALVGLSGSDRLHSPLWTGSKRRFIYPAWEHSQTFPLGAINAHPACLSSAPGAQVGEQNTPKGFCPLPSHAAGK